jgi:hypothetical protein
MKKKDKSETDDEMRPEYEMKELGKGVRGKYVERYREGTNVILLDPDVAKAFPDSKAVNEALRLLMKIAKSYPSAPQ